MEALAARQRNRGLAEGFDADAVLAAGRKGLLLYTSLALDIDEVAETAPMHVGSRARRTTARPSAPTAAPTW